MGEFIYILVDAQGVVKPGTFAMPQDMSQPVYAGLQCIACAPDDQRVSVALAAVETALKPKPSPREWLERLDPARQEAITDAVFLAGGAARLWFIKALGTPAIDVTAPETIGGINAMAAANIITAAEVQTLLAP